MPLPFKVIAYAPSHIWSAAAALATAHMGNNSPTPVSLVPK